MSRSLFGRVVAFLFLLLSLFSVRNAWANSYLERAALLLEEARMEIDFVAPRLHDKELLFVSKSLAEARAKVGGKMEVPAAMAKSHPHLLLVLEHNARALSAAAEGNSKRFLEQYYAAREEERAFRMILAESGHALRPIKASSDRSQ